jgi:hypothetical protein
MRLTPACHLRKKSHARMHPEVSSYVAPLAAPRVWLTQTILYSDCVQMMRISLM